MITNNRIIKPYSLYLEISKEIKKEELKTNGVKTSILFTTKKN